LMFNVVRWAFLINVFGSFMFHGTMVTKLFSVSLCRESRHISSCQNFLLLFHIMNLIQ
jgi:hypothetical protein